MAIKGKTTIELTNVETGEVKTVEDSNMLTNGLKYLLTTFPYESTTVMRKAIDPSKDDIDSLTQGIVRTARLLTGGLILFDTALEENVENIYPPAGVETTGCASSYAYTGPNTVAGSYNVNESGPIENGYKHVWDFGTSQGNGQIACACLTTREGGAAGGGSYPYDLTFCPSSYENPNRQLSYLHNLSYPVEIIDMDSVTPRKDSSRYAEYGRYAPILYADYDKGWYVSPHDYNTILNTTFVSERQLTLDLKRLPLKNYSIFDTTNQVYSNYLSFPVIDTITVSMPDTLNNVIDEYSVEPNAYYTVALSADAGFLYIIITRKVGHRYEYYSITPSDKIHIWKINMDDFTSEHIQVSNTTDKFVLACTSMTNSIANMYVTNNYLFVMASQIEPSNSSANVEYGIYKINLKNNADVSQIVFPDGTPVLFTTYTNSASFKIRAGFHNGYVIKGKLYFIHQGIPAVIDTITNKMYYRCKLIYDEVSNNSSDGSWQIVRSVYVNNSPGIILSSIYYYYSGHSSYTYIRKHTELLLTINNLGNVVTKTTAETMKVTYTLMLEEEQEE